MTEAVLKVMVVDDHPIWRDAVARDLADEGFDVVATADGVASAQRRAGVVRPDVFIEFFFSFFFGFLSFFSSSSFADVPSPMNATTSWKR